MEELMEEFNITMEQENVEDSIPSISEEQVYEFVAMNKRAAKLIGFGVMLMILSPVLLIMDESFFHDWISIFSSSITNDTVGIIMLLLLLLLRLDYLFIQV